MHSRSSVRSRAAPNGNTEMAEEDPRQRYKANLQGEVDGASLYRTLAQTETNPELAQARSGRRMPNSGNARSGRSVNACRACGRAFGRKRSLGWRAVSVRPLSCRAS